MGAYENPTQAIDRESGMIIANAISRIGQQTAQYIQANSDARNKEEERARKEEDIRIATREKNRDVIHANIQKAGGRSQSWFDLADNAINEKYRLEGLLSDAPDEDQENEDGTITYGRQSLHNQINKEKARIRTLTNGLTDINAWKASEGEKLLNSKTNEPGGIYTGSCSEGSSEFNKSICQDYERKMALMGTLTKDGKVVKDVTYEIREIEGIPSVWAKIGDTDAFNVSDVLTQDFAEAENIFKGDDNNGTNAIFDETGLRNKNDKWIDSMLGGLEHVPSIDVNGKKVGMKWIRKVKTDAVIGRLIPEYEAHFLSMVNSVENKQDYNDLMATYLAYSKEGGDLATVADGVYKLTDEAKAKFVQQMVGVALEDKIPGYEVISAKENGDDTVTYINQEGQEVTTGDYKTEYSYVGRQTGEGFEDVKEGQKLIDPTAKTTTTKTQKISESTKEATNLARAGNAFNIPKNKAGILMTDNKLSIPTPENNKSFVEELSKLGFKVDEASVGKGKNEKTVGYYIQKKGAPNTKAFEIEFDNPPTAREFYRELLTAQGVPTSQIEDKLNDILNKLTTTIIPSEKDLNQAAGVKKLPHQLN